MRLPDGRRFVHRLLSMVLVLSCALGPLSMVPALAAGEGTSGVRGLLYEADGSTRLPAARVLAINVTTSERYDSNLTGSNGSYEIQGMPAGTYDIVVESGGKIFVVDNLVTLARGQRVTVSLSVEPRKPSMRRIEGMADPSGTAQFVGSQPGGTGPATGGEPFLKTTGGKVLVTALSIAAALVIYNAVDDDDDPPTSPSGP